MGLGIPLGPLVGGYLLEHYWWGSIFLLNVPVVLVALLAIGLLLPESKDPRPRGADLAGGALSTLGLISLVYAVIEAPGRGWTAPVVLGAGRVRPAWPPVRASRACAAAARYGTING